MLMVMIFVNVFQLPVANFRMQMVCDAFPIYLFTPEPSLAKAFCQIGVLILCSFRESSRRWHAPAFVQIHTRLVEPPVGSGAADIEGDAESREGSIRQINALAGAAHAFVLDGGLDSLAALADGDSLATEWVAIRLGAHELPWKGNDHVNLAIVGNAASTETGLVVSDVSGAW
jgi:hypothetical protein